MNVHGYFQSMGNAIAKEKTGLQIAREDAANALAIWDIISNMKAFSPHCKERGDGVAANLRGTLKNSVASYNSITSLTSDLKWLTKQGSKP